MNLNERTARYLFSAVRKATVNHTDIKKGDYIVVTGVKADISGIVNHTITDRNTTAVTLNTNSGKEETLQISNKNFIHIIQKADMLNMRKHVDYERDLEDIDKNTHQYTEKDRHPVMGPDEKSDKSELPTSKISLMMKKPKTSSKDK